MRTPAITARFSVLYLVTFLLAWYGLLTPFQRDALIMHAAGSPYGVLTALPLLAAAIAAFLNWNIKPLQQVRVVLVFPAILWVGSCLWAGGIPDDPTGALNAITVTGWGLVLLSIGTIFAYLHGAVDRSARQFRSNESMLHNPRSEQLETFNGANHNDNR